MGYVSGEQHGNSVSEIKQDRMPLEPLEAD
jgi:hypothetical protein